MIEVDVVAMADAATEILSSGVDHVGVSRLKKYLPELTSADDPQALKLADELKRTLDAEPDEIPLPLMDLFSDLNSLRNTAADLPAIKGEIKEIPSSGFWSTVMPAPNLYVLVPETRPFAKRAKPEELVEAIESAARRGVIADLRLLQVFLKSLDKKEAKRSTSSATTTASGDDKEKKEVKAPVRKSKKVDAGDVADTAARVAIPAYGPSVLPDLWPTLAPENRTFMAAYKIDINATLARLLETKPGKKADKSGSVTKAVEKLMKSVTEDGESIGPESLPLIKVALKLAPDQEFRRKLAEILANMGEPAKEALPELIETFEHGALKRDYHLIRPVMVLGKDSEDAAGALTRALSDRDMQVRMMAAFNLGQMGPVAFMAIETLENLAEADPDGKVRDIATKTFNKLKQKQFALLPPPPEEEEEDEDEEEEEETTEVVAEESTDGAGTTHEAADHPEGGHPAE